MSADLASVESKLRREIEALEKERREGDQEYESKKQAVYEAQQRNAAARGDGDKASLIKEEMRARLLAQKKDTFISLKNRNDALLEVLKAELDVAKDELRRLREDKKGQQKIYLTLRQKGIAEFQTYSPGVLSESSDSSASAVGEFTKQPSFSHELADDIDSTKTAETGEHTTRRVSIAGDTEDPDEMYNEPALSGTAVQAAGAA